jgi:class 3 adenylate cyclase
MRLFLAGRFGYRVLLGLVLVLVPLVGIAAFVNLRVALGLAVCVTLLLLWDRVGVEREIRNLATRLANDTLDSKLEISDDAWGRLSHALNRLLQQRRSDLRLRNLLPVTPLALATRLADTPIPLDGVSCRVAVLAIATVPDSDDLVDRMRETAFAVAEQAEHYAALMVRSGDTLLLIFGAPGSLATATPLQNAVAAAANLKRRWAEHGQTMRLAMSMSIGMARAVVLPGIGYTVLGTPIDQSLALQTVARSAAVLACGEETYLQLRRLGAAPPLPHVRRVSGTEQTIYAIPF